MRVLPHEEGGISLEQINNFLFWKHHFHSQLNSSHRTRSITLFPFPVNYPYGIDCVVPVQWPDCEKRGISSGNAVDLSNQDFLRSFPLNFSDSVNTIYEVPPSVVNGVAIIAWQGSRDDHRTMKRVLYETDAELSMNSISHNITLPYFAVSKWIKDPSRRFSSSLRHT